MLPLNLSDTAATSQDGSSLEFIAAIAGRQCYIQDASGRGLWDGTPKEDVKFWSTQKRPKEIFLTLIRSHCEQSSSVWHSGLTQQNIDDNERIQKVALKIILKGNYLNYKMH